MGIFIKVFRLPIRLYSSWLVRLSVQLLENLDKNMIKARWPRYKRRQFWREFVKSSAQRQAIELQIKKTLTGVINAKNKTSKKEI